MLRGLSGRGVQELVPQEPTECAAGRLRIQVVYCPYPCCRRAHFLVAQVLTTSAKYTRHHVQHTYSTVTYEMIAWLVSLQNLSNAFLRASSFCTSHHFEAIASAVLSDTPLMPSHEGKAYLENAFH